MESLLGAEDPDEWNNVASRSDPLKKYKPIDPKDWEKIEAIVSRDLPQDWKRFHEAFQKYSHPGQGHWGRIPSKTYIKQVWDPYHETRLPNCYFPIMATGEDYYVLDIRGEIRRVSDDGYNERVAQTLFSWVNSNCTDEN